LICFDDARRCCPSYAADAAYDAILRLPRAYLMLRPPRRRHSRARARFAAALMIDAFISDYAGATPYVDDAFSPPLLYVELDALYAAVTRLDATSIKRARAILMPLFIDAATLLSARALHALRY